MHKILLFLSSLALPFVPAPVRADEVFTGLYAHGVETPLSMDTEEGGTDLQLGYRLDPAEFLEFIGKPSPYAIASLNMNGDTNFFGAGLSWKLGAGPAYVRPELGVVVHDGPSREVSATGRHLELGSRALFEVGVSVGAQISREVAIEASWVHISHAQLCNPGQNPGLDMWGARLNIQL